MFSPHRQATGLLLVVATSLFGIQALSPAATAADPVTNTATVEDVHCSYDEGFAIVMYTTDSVEPVSFVTHVDGTAPKDPILVTSDTPIGDSFGSMVEGTHLLEVFADGTSIHEESIEIICDDDVDMPPPPLEDGHVGTDGTVSGPALPDTGK